MVAPMKRRMLGCRSLEAMVKVVSSEDVKVVSRDDDIMERFCCHF